MNTKDYLLRYYGYSDFRPGQESLVEGVLNGKDVFGIMPTGGGKSICYQLPALMLPGITLVISPLISLMKDQVMALKGVGVPAAYINSTLNAAQMKAVYRNLLDGRYKIVYVAPERLDYTGFSALCERLPIRFVAVDEAHCISQWGQDFRPSYLRIVHFLNNLPVRPVVGAYTATATAQVREDVERILQLREPVRMVTGFDRPNLFYQVLRPEKKDSQLMTLLRARRNRSGIIYCATRKGVETVCDLLLENGFSATRYHAGLDEQERNDNQEDFIHDRKTVMVATNAFGMGIDKSNVTFVIHYNMPKSIEAYYQEAGRAGRDGSESECILLFAEKDIHTAKYLIEHSSDNEEIDPIKRQQLKLQDMDRLVTMVGYCKSNTCLRGYILDYFGQKHGNACGNCGNCLAEYEKRDVTQQAKVLLMCIASVEEKLGYCLGISTIAKILQGSREKKILELYLYQLPCYGKMKTTGRSEIRALADFLEVEGYIETDPEYQVVRLTERSEVVLHGDVSLLMLVAAEQEEKTHTQQADAEADPELFECLRRQRAVLAKKAGIPAYMILTNASLEDMARKKPTTQKMLRTVSGVGETKAQRYGKHFLECIRTYLEES